jgi:hypothetical protein
VPLVTHDPYFSVWSFSDKLTDSWPRHWTGKTMGMCGLARIDGKSYRWCGQPGGIDAMKQTSVRVGPFQTIYEFAVGGITLNVTFSSPTVPTAQAAASIPITTVGVEARSSDGQEHTVSVYLDCSGEWAVNLPQQQIRWSRAKAGDLNLLTIASQDQPVLQKRGDDLRIDWGTFCIAAPTSGDAVLTGHLTSRRSFVETGKLPDSDDLRQPRAADDDFPVAAVAADLGKVGSTPVEWTACIAYDDGYSIELFDRKLRPAWARDGQTISAALQSAYAQRTMFSRGHAAFDLEITSRLARVGGPKYAALAALAFRQTMAAHKVAADWDGTPLMFPKENFSNGCISTVDVIFPSAPFFLYFEPELLKAQLRPLMQYAASARWKFPFAPHDLGTYPLANGQVYGGGEKTEDDQMPVEESGNMLILLAALAQQDGNANFAAEWWPTVEKWAAYLKEKGLDPSNQLCTDDFAGHLAHNANLSIKAIIGLGGVRAAVRQAGQERGRGGVPRDSAAVCEGVGKAGR